MFMKILWLIWITALCHSATARKKFCAGSASVFKGIIKEIIFLRSFLRGNFLSLREVWQEC